jgi:beta-alanine--pyruvate transaminase
MVMSLKGAPHVVDIRTIGLAAAIDLAPHKDGAGKRGFEALISAFEDEKLVIRASGDSLCLAPSLIASESELSRIVEGVRAVLNRVG